MKKILFDNNAFQNLILQPNFHNRFQQLKDLVKNGDFVVFGSISFLEELICFSSKNSVDYKKVLKEYRIITNQNLLKPYNDLIQTEINNGAPLKQENLFLAVEKSKNIFDKLEKSFKLKTLDDLVYNNKQNYLLDMTKANDSVQNLLQKKFSKQEKKTAAKDWLNNFDANIQSWCNDLFNPRREIDCKTLPHIASYISYYFLKMHQAIMEGHKHQKGDLYDCKHIAEAAAVDFFITEDGALIRLHDRIPTKYQFVQVIKIDDLLQNSTGSNNPPKAE